MWKISGIIRIDRSFFAYSFQSPESPISAAAPSHFHGGLAAHARASSDTAPGVSPALREGAVERLCEKELWAAFLKAPAPCLSSHI